MAMAMVGVEGFEFLRAVSRLKMAQPIRITGADDTDSPLIVLMAAMTLGRPPSSSITSMHRCDDVEPEPEPGSLELDGEPGDRDHEEEPGPEPEPTPAMLPSPPRAVSPFIRNSQQWQWIDEKLSCPAWVQGKRPKTTASSSSSSSSSSRPVAVLGPSNPDSSPADMRRSQKRRRSSSSDAV